MANEAAKVTWTETDISDFIAELQKGVYCMLGVTRRGPHDRALKVTNWGDYKRNYGGLLKTHDFPLVAKEALDRGAVVYIGRVVHYTDITTKSTITATASSITLQDRNGVPANTLKLDLVQLGDVPFKVEVKDNADVANTFDILLTFDEDPSLNETYTELTMDDTADNYAVTVINGKSFMWVATDMNSASAAPANNPAVIAATAATPGVAGTAGLVEADYIGDSAAVNGLHLFDEVEDAYGVCTPEIQTRTMIAAGDSYCVTRGDMFYMGEVPTGLDENKQVDFKKGTGSYVGTAFNSNFLALFSGHAKVTDPLTNRKKFVSNMGHVIAIHSKSDTKAQPWFAAAGLERGKLSGATEIDYNMGSPGKRGALDKVAAAGINPFVSFPNEGLVLWGNKTTQTKDSALKQLHVRKLMLYMQKAILPANRYSLFNPNDPTEWKRIYLRVKPLLDELVTLRAIRGYKYIGDQDVDRAEDAQFNTMNDLDDGRYKVRILFTPVSSMEVIGFEGVLTRSGVNFEELAGAGALA